MSEKPTSIERLEIKKPPFKALQESNIKTIGEVVDLIVSGKLHLVPGIWRKGEEQIKSAVKFRLEAYLSDQRSN